MLRPLKATIAANTATPRPIAHFTAKASAPPQLASGSSALFKKLETLLTPSAIRPKNLTNFGRTTFTIGTSMSVMLTQMAANALESLFISDCLICCFTMSFPRASKSFCAEASSSAIFWDIFSYAASCAFCSAVPVRLTAFNIFSWFCCFITSSTVMPAALANASC